MQHSCHEFAKRQRGKSVESRVHIVTVHWTTLDWLELQQRQLKRWLGGVPASLHLGVGGGVNADDPAATNVVGFDRFETTDVNGRHSENLDSLIAQMAVGNPSDNDLLMVLDQDAFPIKSLTPSVRHVLETGEPLSAVRTENHGDAQPHPMFFLCRLSMWSALAATWREGPVQLGRRTRRRDVGGTLLQQLHDANQSWVRLPRSADNRLHPVLYGVYGDLIYHHGAASRPVWTETDAQRSYPNTAYRVLDGALYRMRLTKSRSRRFREEAKMAAGHARQTEMLMRDPAAYMNSLQPLKLDPVLGAKADTP